MITIHIKKPKASQMKRTMSGCGFRITEGDYPIMVKKDLVNKIRNKFNKGKSHTLYAHEFEGGSLASLYKQAKKGITEEIKKTGKELQQEAIETGKEIKKQAIKEGNIFVRDVAKPYLTEMVQSGILGVGTALAVVQPELAPFIGVGTLALSSMAGNYIDEFGNKKPKPKSAYVSPQDYQQYQPYEPPTQTLVPADYINPTEIARSKMNYSIDDFQRANRMIGFGFGRNNRNNYKVGNGLFAGGTLTYLTLSAGASLINLSTFFFVFVYTDRNGCSTLNA
jgi:hypothetical protein